MTKDKRVEMLEHFANIEHERWSRWQRYMHSKMIIADMPNGERFAMLPIEFFERWERQINTSYAELSEAEKESDREQVRPYLDYFTQYHQDLMSEVVGVLEECNYEVDVDKVPSIQDEAWANQYDSKAEAFWYGERQGLKALTEAQTIIKSK